MFGFVKRTFVSRMMFFGCSLLSVNPVECVSMNNQECKVIQEMVNVNTKEPVLFPFSTRTSKCSGSCNNINDLYAKQYVSDVVKNLNTKGFNLMSRTTEKRHTGGALRDPVPFVKFKKREKHPWRGVNFSKVAGLTLIS